MTMNLVKNKRSERYCLMSDFELVSGRPGDGKPRGKLVVRTGQWSLEDQVNLAKRIQRKHWRDPEQETMCTRNVRTSSGAIRICGRALKQRNDGYNRARCGSCSPDLIIPEYVGVRPKHKQTLYESTEATSVVKESCSVGTTADLSDCSSYAVPTADAETQTITRQMRIVHQAPINIEPKMKWYISDLWDDSYAKSTLYNARSGMKKGLEYLNLDKRATKKQFLEATSDIEHVYTTFVAQKNTDNMIKAFRLMLRYFNEPGRAERLQVLWDADHVNPPEPLSVERRQLITTLAKHLKLDMLTERPGQLLLTAIQERIMEFEPTNTEERARTFDQMLAFWMPLARAGTTRFRFCRKKPAEDTWEKHNKNLVVVQKGHIEGIFFGDIKFTKTKRTPYYKKRIWLDMEGIDTLDMGRHVMPCHMLYTFQAWRRKLFSILVAQYEENGRMGQIFKHIPKWPLEMFGVPNITSLDSRMLFRNGVPEVDQFFIKKIMNHTKACDQEFYVKKELLEGPFSVSP